MVFMFNVPDIVQDRLYVVFGRGGWVVQALCPMLYQIYIAGIYFLDKC